jgi:hypothetical protein
MDKFVGAVALIRHPIELEKQWLAHWDPRYGHYDFVIAARLENDSFRECLDREIAWSLPLRKGKDYLISSVARLHLDATLLISGHSAPMPVTTEFFVVDLYGKSASARVADDPNTRWVTSSEVLDTTTKCGHSISPQLSTMIRIADVFPPNTH